MAAAFQWEELNPWFEVDLLTYVDDVSKARRMADQLELARPGQENRLPAGSPLTALAKKHPGELLWRLVGRGSSDWQVGIAELERFIEADSRRVRGTHEDARARRRVRRHANGR